MARSRDLYLSFLFVLVCTSLANAQFGAEMSSVGAINRSMAGASTAAPLDTLGAFLWNPATISALPNSADMSVELLVPQSKLSSSIAANSFGPGIPAINLSGSDNSTAGVFPLPNLGIVYQPGLSLAFGTEEEMPITFGIGVLTAGGFGSNFPGSTTNPLLTAPPPNGLGVGPLFAQYVMTEITPTVSLQVNERLSIGFSPIVDLANLSVDPGILATPNSGIYPPLNNGSYQWGGGFQVGAFYKTDNYWQFGTSFKSPQWFEGFQFNTHTPAGTPRSVTIPVNSPLIVSFGSAYTGFERWLLALDMRYVDYRNIQPFSTSGFAPTGAVNGLGWKDVFALATGAQYLLTDAVSLRAGYSFNTNPISNSQTFFNAATPLDIQHGIYCGGSWSVTERFKLSLAYMHLFASTISGPWYGASGPLAGTNVTATSSADSVIASSSFFF